MALPAEHKERILFAASILSFVALAGWLLFGPSNAIQYYKVVRELDEIKRQNTELANQNDLLHEEIEKLTKDKDYLEKISREQLGLLKKNEIVFDFGTTKR